MRNHSHFTSRVHPLAHAPGSERRAYVRATDKRAALLASQLMNRMIALGITSAEDDPQCSHMAATLIARIDGHTNNNVA